MKMCAGLFSQFHRLWLRTFESGLLKCLNWWYYIIYHLILQNMLLHATTSEWFWHSKITWYYLTPTQWGEWGDHFPQSFPWSYDSWPLPPFFRFFHWKVKLGSKLNQQLTNKSLGSWSSETLEGGMWKGQTKGFLFTPESQTTLPI